MKNKKLRLFVIAILILQILMPAGLLYHHYSLHSRAMNDPREFKFRLDNIDIYDIYNSGEGDERLSFDILDLFDYYHQDIAVTIGNDGYAQMSLAENKMFNKYWFTFKYCYSKSYANNDNYTYEDGVDVAELHKMINRIYSKDIKKPDNFYITAKVYKGVFIPIAIYIEDVKVITFSNNK